MKPDWKEVYRSANKRILRRKHGNPPVRVKPERVTPPSVSIDGVPTAYAAGGLFVFSGVLIGGVSGLLLIGLGVLLFVYGN